MGGHIYYYFVPFQEDANAALQALRRQEFEAGRYNPALQFPFDDWPSPDARGAKHRTIEAAIEASEADGTRSILDMERIGSQADFGVVMQLSPDKLNDLYGTASPTHEMIKENMDFFEEIERGQGIYIVVYKDDRPSELFFAGISYD